MREVNRFGGGAWQAYTSGRLEEAEKLCRRSLQSNLDDGGAWELLGLALHDLKRFHEAADALERAGLIVPLIAEARLALAASYGQLRRRRLATELYLELMLHGSLSPELMLVLAAGLDVLDEPRLAMEACRRAAKQDPGLAQVHYDMGYYARRCGYPVHLSEALARKALELDPASIEFRLGLVSLLFKETRYEEAYRVACGFSVEQIATIKCACCLDRLRATFTLHEDDERVGWCQGAWVNGDPDPLPPTPPTTTDAAARNLR